MRFRYSATVFVLLLLASSAQAQITITRDDVEQELVPQVVTYYDAQNVEGATFNLGSAGPNQTFDFTGFTYSSYTANSKYEDPEATPYFADFPEATHAMASEEQGSVGYSYLVLEDHGLEVLGFGGDAGGFPFTFRFDPAMLVMKFPMTLGTTWVYSGNDVSPVEGLEMGINSNSNIVSSGTLVLPGGSYQALCQKTVSFVTTRFSIQGQVLSEGVSMDVSYTFHTKEGVSVTMDVDTLDVNSMTPKILGISYTVPSSQTGVTNGPDAGAFALAQNYPNPVGGSAGSQTSIRWTSQRPANTALRVYDLQGRLVATAWEGFAPAGEHQRSFDTSTLRTGVYVLQLAADGFTRQRLMSIVR